MARLLVVQALRCRGQVAQQLVALAARGAESCTHRRRDAGHRLLVLGREVGNSALVGAHQQAPRRPRRGQRHAEEGTHHRVMCGKAGVGRVIAQVGESHGTTRRDGGVEQAATHWRIADARGGRRGHAGLEKGLHHTALRIDQQQRGVRRIRDGAGQLDGGTGKRLRAALVDQVEVGTNQLAQAHGGVARLGHGSHLGDSRSGDGREVGQEGLVGLVEGPALAAVGDHEVADGLPSSHQRQTEKRGDGRVTGRQSRRGGMEAGVGHAERPVLHHQRGQHALACGTPRDAEHLGIGHPRRHEDLEWRAPDAVEGDGRDVSAGQPARRLGDGAQQVGLAAEGADQLQGHAAARHPGAELLVGALSLLLRVEERHVPGRARPGADGHLPRSPAVPAQRRLDQPVSLRVEVPAKRLQRRSGLGVEQRGKAASGEGDRVAARQRAQRRVGFHQGEAFVEGRHAQRAVEHGAEAALAVQLAPVLAAPSDGGGGVGEQPLDSSALCRARSALGNAGKDLDDADALAPGRHGQHDAGAQAADGGRLPAEEGGLAGEVVDPEHLAGGPCLARQAEVGFGRLAHRPERLVAGVGEPPAPAAQPALGVGHQGSAEVVGEQAAAERDDHGLELAVRTELAEDALDVAARGVDAHAQAARDALRVAAAGQAAEHVELARGEQVGGSDRRLAAVAGNPVEHRGERGAVDDHAAVAGHPDRLEHLLDAALLGQEAGHSRRRGPSQHAHGGVRGEHDHAGVRVAAAQPCDGLDAVPVGQLDVDEDHVGDEFGGEALGLLDAAGGAHAVQVGLGFDGHGDSLRHRVVVVDHEDARLPLARPAANGSGEVVWRKSHVADWCVCLLEVTTAGRPM